MLGVPQGAIVRTLVLGVPQGAIVYPIVTVVRSQRLLKG